MLGPVVTFFAVFGEIETDGLHFLIRPQSNHSFHDESNDRRADDRQHQCYADGFNLGNPLSVIGDGLGETGGDVMV